MITKSDITGNLTGLPLWIVRLMVIRAVQAHHGELVSVANFVSDRTVACGGFRWYESPEEHSWWECRIGLDHNTKDVERKPLDEKYLMDLCIFID